MKLDWKTMESKANLEGGGGWEEALDVDTIETSASSSSHLGLWSLGS